MDLNGSSQDMPKIRDIYLENMKYVFDHEIRSWRIIDASLKSECGYTDE